MGLLDSQPIHLRDTGVCPFDKAECVRDQCMAWMRHTRVKDDATGHEEVVGCALTFIPVLLGQMIVEQVRCQASSDKVATEVRMVTTEVKQSGHTVAVGMARALAAMISGAPARAFDPGPMAALPFDDERGRT